jgi:predicted phage terminase large subunit-like protein
MDDLLPTPGSAAAELLARKAARESLGAFSTYVQPNYQENKFSLACDRELERIERGEIDRLMIFAPPRHGKSQKASIHFPAWFMARNPGQNVIAATYNGDFAADFGRKVRAIALSEAYPKLWPGLGIDPQSRAADRWKLTTGGEYFAVGVGTATTGRGAHLFMIDDPVKDRAEADSPTIRQQIKDWYQDVAYTRLEEGGRVVIMMTRWHSDDLAGWLEEEMATGSGDSWTVLRCPAICEDFEDPLGRRPGEALWPEKYDVDELARKRKVAGPRGWASLYQQRPVLAEGGMFRPENLPTIPVESLEKNSAPFVRLVRAWDLAATAEAKGDPDYSVGVLMGKTRDGTYVVVDVTRFRGGPLEVEQRIKDTARSDLKRWGHVTIKLPQDPGQAGKSQAQRLVRMLAGFAAKAERCQGDKAVRATGFASQVEALNVRLVKSWWNEPFKDELAVFPLGKHDDQVDAAADAFNELQGKLKPRTLQW